MSATRIVVGVDGSTSSLAALDWAYDYAAMSGAQVNLVTAWQWPYMYSGFGLPILAAEFDPKLHAEELLEKLVAEAPLPAGRVSTTCVASGAGAALVEASKDADLLVVGAKGHGPVGRMLLGSVSTECVHHARCGIVVIPRDRIGHPAA